MIFKDIHKKERSVLKFEKNTAKNSLILSCLPSSNFGHFIEILDKKKYLELIHRVSVGQVHRKILWVDGACGQFELDYTKYARIMIIGHDFIF